MFPMHGNQMATLKRKSCMTARLGEVHHRTYQSLLLKATGDQSIQVALFTEVYWWTQFYNVICDHKDKKYMVKDQFSDSEVSNA